MTRAPAAQVVQLMGALGKCRAVDIAQGGQAEVAGGRLALFAPFVVCRIHQTAARAGIEDDDGGPVGQGRRVGLEAAAIDQEGAVLLRRLAEII